MALPSICIIAASAKDDGNRVWAAMGKGPLNFVVPLTTADPPQVHSPITHYVSADGTSQVEDVTAWQAMQNGELPPDIEWGENGVISAEAAIAAVSAENLQVFSASGNISAANHLAGILLGYTPPLSLLPPEL